eukprot:1177702-Prorocentrum_minimum.AAC.1
MPAAAETVLNVTSEMTRPGEVIPPHRIRHYLERLDPLIQTDEGAFAFAVGPEDDPGRSGLRWLSAILSRHASVEEAGGNAEVDYVVLSDLMEVGCLQQNSNAFTA